MPCSATARAVVRFQIHIGGRKKRGRCPIVRSRMSCVRRICARCTASRKRVILGCDQEWLPTTMPAARSSRTIPGDCCTFRPITKNVACACSDCSSRRIGSVNGPGPSSNVSATRPLRAGGATRCDVRPAHGEDRAVAADRERERDGVDACRRQLGAHHRARERAAPIPADRPARGRRAVTAAVQDDGGDRDHREGEQRGGEREQPPAQEDASSGAERRRPPRRARGGNALRGQLEARIDHHEARELRAEHEAVGIAHARQRAAARDDEHARSDEQVGAHPLVPAQRAHDAGQQRERAEGVERDRVDEREPGERVVRRRTQPAVCECAASTPAPSTPIAAATAVATTAPVTTSASSRRACSQVAPSPRKPTARTPPAR